MKKFSKNWIFMFVLICALFLKDAPYVNTLFLDKIWIVDGILILTLLLSVFYFSERKNNFLIFLLIIIAALLSLFQFTKLADAVGIALYLLLWLAVLMQIKSFVSHG